MEVMSTSGCGASVLGTLLELKLSLDVFDCYKHITVFTVSLMASIGK